MSESMKPDIPSRDWQWNHESGPTWSRYDGVHTWEGCLTWYTEVLPGFAGGGAGQQSFEDFLERGPAYSCPPEVEAELRRLLEPLRQSAKPAETAPAADVPPAEPAATRVAEVGYQSRLRAGGEQADEAERYAVGERIGGRYEVLALHRGSMGVVYATFDHELGLPRALKTLRRRFDENETMRRLFAEEAALWVRLGKHPFIVRAYLVHSFREQPYVVMEYIRGVEGIGADLRSWIGHPRLTQPLAAEMALQIAQGMQHAVGKVPGLVHRDLKPANVLVDDQARAMVTDFGLVHAAEATAGTPAYMAPEQWQGHALTARTDVYAYGCIVYEMLTGHRLHAARTIDEWRIAHLHADPVAPRSLKADLPEGLEGFVLRCLAKRPEDRPGGWDEVVGVAARWFHQLTGRPVVLDFSIYDPTPDELNGAAYSLNSLERWEEAIGVCDRILALDPSLPAAWANKGRALDSLRRSEEALSAYDRALALAPELAVVWNNRGFALANLGRHEEALAAYDRASSLDGEDPVPWSNKGLSLIELARLDEALAALDRAVALGPDDAVAWFKRGLALDRLGRTEAAVEAYDRATALKADFLVAWHNKGSELVRLGRYEEALSAFDAALTLDPQYFKSVADRGLALRFLNRHEEALAACERALSLRPDEGRLWSNKGVALDDLGRKEEALAAYERALELDTANAFAWRSKAGTLYDLGRLEEALAASERALAIDPDSEDGRQIKANVLARLAEDPRAVELFGALENGQVDVVRALLGAGVKPDVRDANRNTALIVAAREKQEEIVELLVAAGADVEAINAEGQTALLWAAARDSVPIARVLINAGAKIEYRDDKHCETPLLWAVARLSADEKDMDEAVFWSMSRTPETGGEVALLLLEAGTDPNHHLHGTGPPLEYAAVCALEVVVERLLACGADPCWRDESGNSLLTDVDSRLVGYGDSGIKGRIQARLREAIRQTGGALALIECSRAGNLDRVKALLEQGVGVDERGDWGETALIAASGAGQLETVRFLLAAGADVSLSDRWKTALDRAALEGHHSVVKMLLAAGGRLETTRAMIGPGATALSFAACNGRVEVVKALLDARVPVDGPALRKAIATQSVSHVPREIIEAILSYIEAQT